MRKGEKEAGATRETIRAEELASTLEKLFELMQIGGRMFPSKTVAEMLTAMLYRAVEDERLLEEGLTVDDVADAMRKFFGPSSVRDRARLNAYLNRLGERGLLEVRSGRPSRYNVRKLLEDPSTLVNIVKMNVQHVLNRIEEIYYSQLSLLNSLRPDLLASYSRLLRRPALVTPPRYVHEAFISELNRLDRYSHIVGIGLTHATLVWARPHEEIAGTPVENFRSELRKLMESKNAKLIYITAFTDILRHRLEKGDITLQKVFALASTLYRHLRDERLKGKLIVIDLDVEDLAKVTSTEPRWILEEGRYYGFLAVFALDEEWRIVPESVVVNTLIPSEIVKGKLISEGIVYSGTEAYQRALLATLWLKSAVIVIYEKLKKAAQKTAQSTITSNISREALEDLTRIAAKLIHPKLLQPYLSKDLIEFAKIYSEEVTIQRLKEMLRKVVDMLE
ncbi:MAG: hypothetical protein DRK00_04060 [Thermoprotei archaeon]|nr:MAG: hypothetical protein DRK00_04060 [Thermoprotei archaeon]